MNNSRIHSLWRTALPLNHIKSVSLDNCEICLRWKHGCLCPPVHMLKSVEAGKDHFAGTPEKLLKAADCGGMLIMLESWYMLFLLATFIVVVKRLLLCVSSDLDYRLPLDACCPEFLHNCLSYTVVSQSLLAGVFFTTLFIILSILFTPSRCFHRRPRRWIRL